MASLTSQTALNGICPYFTMFPLDFPLNILRKRAQKGEQVLDPFCGRGTTNFAARLVGLTSLGVDSSPVAEAITASKLVTTTEEAIVAESRQILDRREPCHIPVGEFWLWAYHPTVLDALCRLREALLENCSTPARIALRGILLGALHGPQQKNFASYFSNQCPRTYAPKPAYATRFWQERQLFPQEINVLDVIERRAKRYYNALPVAIGSVRLADSRQPEALRPSTPSGSFHWVITSPPYYGMRTYIPDQWLRNWFLGGPDVVDYTCRDQVVHSSPDDFAADLRQVWRNAAVVCAKNARMVVRFGGIADRSANPRELIKHSFIDSGWRIKTIREAGSALEGRRQADTFLRNKSKPLAEYDVWAAPMSSETRNAKIW
jgi:DNA modification methylase